jgi:hypothetical protein
VHACLLELRVYAEDPAMMWRAQKSLWGANWRYLGLALEPALWMALPLAVLLIHLDAFYGRAPLPVGRDAVLTAAFRSPIDGPIPELLPPPGVELSAPPVRILDRNEISWRIRPARPLSGILRLRIHGQEVTKTIDAGAASRFIAGRRVSSPLAALWHPDEPPISTDTLRWIDIPYPEASISAFGIHMNWLIWFFIVSLGTALALKKRFGVAL